MSFINFKLSSTAFEPLPGAPLHSPSALTNSTATSVTFQIPDYDPGHATMAISGLPAATATGLKSFNNDLRRGYTLRWASIDQMRAWLCQEQKTHGIEFVSKEIVKNKSSSKDWVTKHEYVCARQGSGGDKKHLKTKEWGRKVPTKRVEGGCKCKLSVKSYLGTTELLGRYHSEHSHLVGDANLRFTRLPEETRAEIERLLRLGVEPKKVVRYSDLHLIVYMYYKYN